MLTATIGICRPILALSAMPSTLAKPRPTPAQAAPHQPASSLAWGWVVLACLLPVVLAVLLHGWSQQPQPRLSPALLTLKQGLLFEQGGLQPPSGGVSPSRPAALPLSLDNNGKRMPVWLVLPFTVDEQPAGTWLLNIQHRRNLLVYLDGQLLAQSVAPDAVDERNLALRLGSSTLVATVPPAWLQPGQHVLQLRLGAAKLTNVSAVMLGPPETLASLDRTRGFWFALRGATALCALVVGLFLVGIWVANRDALAYAFAGAHLLLLALLLSPYLMPGQPLPSPWWRMLLDMADVLAKALLLATVVRLARPHDAWAMRVAWVYAAVGVVVDGSAAALDLSWNDFSHPWPWWALGSRLAILALATVVALRALQRRPRFDRLATAVLVGLSMCIWAYVSFFSLLGPRQFNVVDLNVVAHAAWVLWMGSLLYRHFVQTAGQERLLREENTQALADRTQELQISFAALQVSETQRLATAERERLLQEMHDGLGSQLMSARMNAQGGLLSPAEMVTALDDCIQEMRMTVDTLSVADGDLGLLLASVRHRAEPGLRAAGLTLAWQIAEAPCLPVLEGGGGRELVRILQEALSNVMHHAQATRVTFQSEATADGQTILLRLIDNGHGLQRDSASGRPEGAGRGTRNMQQRAQRLGARISWLSPAPGNAHAPGGPGTELRIELPVGVPLLARIERPFPQPRSGSQAS